jgi:hypothetical protein
MPLPGSRQTIKAQETQNMNRLLALLVFCLLVGSVSAIGSVSLDFQNPSEFVGQYSYPPPMGAPASFTWVQSSTGGNNYMNVVWTGSYAAIVNANPTPMTYAAATYLGGNGGHQPGVFLYDSAFNTLASASQNWGDGRWELKMEGLDANLYIDGVLTGSLGTLSQNPSYIAWSSRGEVYWDDIIWGDTGSKYIFGMPEDNLYFIMKDFLNPAATGFYRVNLTDPTGAPTLIYSNKFYSTFSKASGTDETVVLYPYAATGYTMSNQTGTAYTGTIEWNLTQFTSTSQANGYGLYATKIVNQIPTTAPYVVSHTIPYIGSGASIQFDRNTYSTGDTATITYVITDGYWDTATYAYTIVTQDIYGTIIDTQTVTTQTGTKSVAFSDTDVLGVYYTVLEATPSGADAIWMNYDVADLNAYITYSGYVMNAESGAVLSGAHLNVSQGSSYLPTTSAADGNWSSSNNWYANSAMRINTTATGYTQDIRTFTALSAKSIAINISLMPDPPTSVGVTIGGIVRDDQYGNPVTGATYHVGAHTATTNIAGFARAGSLVHGTAYDVYSTKAGYADSPHYTRTALGV